MFTKTTKKQNIVIPGHKGKWSAISEIKVKGKTFYAMEHNQYGDEAPMLIVDIDNKVVTSEYSFIQDFIDDVKIGVFKSN